MLGKNEKPLKLAVALAAVAFCSTSALAEIVTVDFSGTINPNWTRDTTGFFARAGVVGGDILRGSFSYDTSATPVSSWSGGSGEAWASYYPSAPTHASGFFWTIGNSKVAANAGVGAQIGILTSSSTPWHWMMNLQAAGDMVNTATGERFSGTTSWGWIADRDTTQVSMLGLGVNLPTSSMLQLLANPAMNLGYESFFRDNNMGSNNVGLDFELTNYSWTVSSATASQAYPPSHVSEPGSLALLCLGGIGLVASSRRCRLSTSTAKFGETGTTNSPA